ncbi:CvpA family protein [Staphylospora marina]|uniref:CvpA family protein n=1 Tax=Staphylospora marina TaxID=2490858 RepID=UPI0013DE57E7|nr:CvpA family protein [Staphylospora marina]
MLDLILLFLLAGSVLHGLRTGLVQQAVSLVAWLAAAWGAWQFSDELTPVISGAWPLDDVGRSGWMSLLPVEQILHSTMAFIVLFFGIRFLFLLAAPILNLVADLPLISWVNRLGGAGLSLLKFVLVTVIAVHLLHVLPWEAGNEAVSGSLIADMVLDWTPDLKDGLINLLWNQAG